MEFLLYKWDERIVEVFRTEKFLALLRVIFMTCSVTEVVTESRGKGGISGQRASNCSHTV